MRTKKRFRKKGGRTPSEATGFRISMVDPSKLSIIKEIDSIIKHAQDGEGRIVAIADLVLFSVEDGDAWILDVEDGLALRLADSCEPLEFNVQQSGTQFSIAWTSTFAIEDGMFYAFYSEGIVSMHSDYPVSQIETMIWKMQQARQPAN